MNTVIFLTIALERGNLGTENSREMKIREALMEEIEGGLGFERLAEMNAEEAWRVIDDCCL